MSSHNSKLYFRTKHSLGNVSVLRHNKAGGYGIDKSESVPDVAEICLYDRTALGSRDPEAKALRDNIKCRGKLVVKTHPLYGAVAVCEAHKERL